VTTDMIYDGYIVDVDVSPTAAILGTKIDPDFGTLDIATTGTLASGSATITGSLSTTSTATIGDNTITELDGTPGQVLTTDGAGSATWQDTSPTAIMTTARFSGNGLAGDPLELADNAVTTDKIFDGTIVDVDVSPTAAILGTKIDPDFGTLDRATARPLPQAFPTRRSSDLTTSTATIGDNTITELDGTPGQ